MLGYILVGLACLIVGSSVTFLIASVGMHNKISYAYMEGFVEGQKSTKAGDADAESL